MSAVINTLGTHSPLSLQTLRLIKYLCDKGAHDFRRAMARQSAVVRYVHVPDIAITVSIPYRYWFRVLGWRILNLVGLFPRDVGRKHWSPDASIRRISLVTLR